MNANDLSRQFVEVWGLLKQAPVPVVTAALVIAAVMFAVFQWRYSGQIESLNERIKVKDDLIASYKSKLDGASPDDARARIDRLEAWIKNYRPTPDDVLKALRDGRITPTADGGFRKQAD